MFAAADTEAVVRLRPPALDPYGDPLPGSTSEVDIGGCLFAPGGSFENLDHAQQVDSDATLYCPPGTDIAASDRIRARGELFQVTGKPQVWQTTGVVVQLRRVTG